MLLPNTPSTIPWTGSQIQNSLRPQGHVTPAKDQGNTNDCSLFAATAVIESQHSIRYLSGGSSSWAASWMARQAPVPLSEQQFVDCTHYQVGKQFVDCTH